MGPIALATRLDNTLLLLLRPYTFIPDRARRLGTDVFETRLLLQKTTCLTGAEAARVFYDEDRFIRHGAAPHRLVATLFGKGGVQGLDGEAHRRRKQMFLSLMTPAALQHLSDLTVEEWRRRIVQWQSRERIVLLDEVSEILCQAVCTWAGVPLPADRVPPTTALLTALVEGAGAVGPRHWRGRWARKRAERWAGKLITTARRQVGEPDGTALRVIATHRDPDGRLLDRRVAAVELLNVLLPTIAVARFVTFAALALQAHPQYREQLRSSDDPAALERFVQEVRRFYPFFPFVAARAAREFTWHGYRFQAGRRVLLDLHGTNHEPQRWERPQEFRPERFQDWGGDPFNFIPQGGGEHDQGHRCAGEWITISLMKVAVTALTRHMTYAVPPQDLRIPPWRAPAAPRSRFVITQVSAQ